MRRVRGFTWAILFLHGLKSIKLRHPQRVPQIIEIPSESRYFPIDSLPEHFGALGESCPEVSLR